MFAGATGTAPAPPRPDASRKGTQFSLPQDDRPQQVETCETITTDNASTYPQNELTNKPPQDFDQTPRKKTKTEGPLKAQNNPESKPQSAPSDKDEQPNMVQNCSAEHPVAAEQGTDLVAARIRAGRQLAQLITNSKTDKSSPVTGQAAKPDEIILLLTTDKSQLGLKTVLPETSKSPITTNTQPSQGKNGDKIPVLNKTVVDTKALTNGGNVKELIPEATVNDAGKTTTAAKKPVIADVSEASVSSTKDLMSEIPADSSNKTNTAGEKTAILNANLQAAQDKASQTQPQFVVIDPGKAVPAARNDNKATAPRILSETSGGNGKESSHSGNNLSDESLARKLNVTDVQASTGQPKGQGSSTSNGSSFSGLEQILSHNNPQAPITEQFLTSAENVKTADLPVQTSSNDVSADIGKQILESVHSSMSQQGLDRQITVRLHPPELGKVLVKFQEQDSQITGILEVSKTQTRLEIEQALPQITRNLTDSGIQIKRLEVVLSDEEQSAQQGLRDPLLQDGLFQQHSSSNSGSSADEQETIVNDDWLTNDSIYQNVTELQNMLVTDSSINMLV